MTTSNKKTDKQNCYFLLSYSPIILTLIVLLNTLIIIFCEVLEQALLFELAGKISLIFFGFSAGLLFSGILITPIINIWYFNKIRETADMKTDYSLLFQPFMAGPRYYDVFYENNNSGLIKKFKSFMDNLLKF